MRIAFWASGLAALLVHAIALADAYEPRTVSSPGRSGSERADAPLEFRTRDGSSVRIRVQRDATVAAKARPSAIETIGEIEGVAVLVIDSYPSVPGGMSYCQAGKERFLRVVSISQRPPRETFSVKIESCRDNVELASPGLEWRPETATLRIQWLLGPTEQGKPEVRSVRVGRDGKPG